MKAGGGAGKLLAAMAAMAVESRPPLRHTAMGTSAIRVRSTAEASAAPSSCAEGSLAPESLAG